MQVARFILPDGIFFDADTSIAAPPGHCGLMMRSPAFPPLPQQFTADQPDGMELLKADATFGHFIQRLLAGGFSEHGEEADYRRGHLRPVYIIPGSDPDKAMETVIEAAKQVFGPDIQVIDSVEKKQQWAEEHAGALNEVLSAPDDVVPIGNESAGEFDTKLLTGATAIIPSRPRPRGKK